MTVAVVVFLAGVVVFGAERAHQAPRVRLHAGAAWLASSKVGHLTLLDGASAEVAARVPVAQPGSTMRASQLGSTGYALNRTDGTVARVDGATQQPTYLETRLAAPGAELTMFPTEDTFFALDSTRGLLTPLDPVTLAPRGTPQSLAAQVTPDGSAVDDEGRVWVFDQRTGDLVWISADGRQSRTHAATPGKTRLVLTGGQPALLDLARRTAELIDPETGEVVHSTQADLRPDDTVTVSGSPQQRRLLLTIGSRGLLVVCTFDADTCAPPVPLGQGKADLGAAIEINDHVIVPDYATGRIWIVNLNTMQVVIERQLLQGPVRFELVTRDGVVFYNDPDSEHAGVLDLDGRVRAVAKYDPVQLDKGPVDVAVDSRDRRKYPGPPIPSGPSDPGPVTTEPGSQPGDAAVAIVVKPSDRGLVGDQFDLTVVPRDPARVGSARWTFGDGTGDTGTSVRHRWTSPGQYQVIVAATTTTGQSASATATITVDAQAAPEITSIDINPARPQVHQRVRFSAGVTGRPDSWEWKINGAAIATTPGFEYTFPTAGSYTVTLAVQSGTARTERSRQLTVAPETRSELCGTTLTKSITLKSDLVCDGDFALKIGANNVVLDLGGHTISTQAPTKDSSGVLVDTANNATIRNGKILHFKYGIHLRNTTGVRISNITASSSSDRIEGADILGGAARDVRAHNVTLTGSMAFAFDHGSTFTMTDSTASYHSRPLRPISEARCRHDSTCVVERSKLDLTDLSCSTKEREVDSSIVIDGGDLDINHVGEECDSVTVKNGRVRPGYVSAVNALEFTGNTVTGGHEHNISVKKGTFLIDLNTFIDMVVGLQILEGRGKVSNNEFSGNQLKGLSIGPEPVVEITGNTFNFNGNDSPPSNDWERGGLIVRERRHDVAKLVVTNNHSFDNNGYGFWVPIDSATGTGNSSTKDKFRCHGVDCGD
jgi:PKD repeat protein